MDIRYTGCFEALSGKTIVWDTFGYVLWFLADVCSIECFEALFDITLVWLRFGHIRIIIYRYSLHCLLPSVIL